jgi:hypothetical protein
VSESLREFLRSNVPSYDELGLLLLLRRESARTWSPAEAGDRLALSPDFALVAMQKLRDIGLLKSRARRGVVRFRFAPKTDEISGQVNDLAHCYEVDRASVAEIMSQNSVERVRAAAARTLAKMLTVPKRKRRSP